MNLHGQVEVRERGCDLQGAVRVGAPFGATQLAGLATEVHHRCMEQKRAWWDLFLVPPFKEWSSPIPKPPKNLGHVQV